MGKSKKKKMMIGSRNKDKRGSAAKEGKWLRVRGGWKHEVIKGIP
jgi:hypothetical protein